MKKQHADNRTGRPSSLDTSQQLHYDLYNYIDRELDSSPRSFDDENSFKYNFDETDDEKSKCNSIDEYNQYEDDEDDEEHHLENDQIDR